MSVRNNFLLAMACIFLAGCATQHYYGNNSRVYSDNSPKSMGVRYLLGRGVEQNDDKAFYNFKIAAKQGDALAANELAWLYAAGKGTPRDPEKAFKWYKVAANKGLASAQFNLALLYLHGIGVAKNQAAAKEWLNKSAAHGFEPARLKLNQFKSQV